MPSGKIISKGIGKAADKMFQEDGTMHPQAQSVVTKLLSVQRPAVLAYIRSIRRRHPDASPQEVARIIEKHYVNLATGGGAAVGATAVVPGLGTTAAVGLAALETAGFLEGSALYAQAIAELHGLPVREPARANALIMGLMLGGAGRDLVRKFAGQASGAGPAITSSWGTLVVKQIPSQLMDLLTKRMRKLMVRKFAGRTAGSLFGRILPFGVGAVIGGVVNRAMAQKVVANSRHAFDGETMYFERETEPSTSTPLRDADLVGGLKHFRELMKQRRASKKNADMLVDKVVESYDEHAPAAQDTHGDEDGTPGKKKSRLFNPKNALL